MTDEEILRCCFEYLESETQMKLDKSTREQLLQQINTPGLALEDEMRLQRQLVGVETNIGSCMSKMLVIERIFTSDQTVWAQVKNMLPVKESEKI